LNLLFPVTYYRQWLGEDLNKLAFLMSKAGRPLAEIEPLCREAVTVQEGLLDERPHSATLRKDLAYSLGMLGHVCRNSRRPIDAEKVFCRAIAIWEALVDEFPANPEYPEKVAAALLSLVMVYTQETNYAGAVPLCEEALRQEQKAARLAGRSDPETRKRLRVCHLGVAHVLVQARRYAEGVRWLADARKEFPDDPEVDFEAGLLLPFCSILAQEDAGLAVEERAKLAEGYAVEAVRSLRRVAAAGRPIPRQVREAPNLKAFRERDDVRKLLAELDAKSKPNG
jgi:hypothetical protein